MKPYTYTDADGDTIRIEDGAITATATADQQSVFVALPDVADEAIELARQESHLPPGIAVTASGHHPRDTPTHPYPQSTHL